MGAASYPVCPDLTSGGRRDSRDAGPAIGPSGLARVAEAVPIPVVGIGGITARNARLLSDSGAAGIAVIGAVAGAEDPGRAVRELMRAFGR